ncbi:hypothetical protein KIK84_06220 [Curvibacter sp. CHRR-16]|uniref:hypothetical protein n=1 Tax=Curvibacter sp. CHRR-16 TaxID=2835872 RepID=UPI001BDB3B58|nr:hypothetical protein [Curvibacter sp. CHRR-16]MBT0569915.1 hypothetical protein [Curvibacter sp. CHRR-16]
MGIFSPTVRSMCIALALTLPGVMPTTAWASKHTTAAKKPAESAKKSSKKSKSPQPAAAQSANDRLSEEFTPLAGNRDAALDLVEALRTGKPQGSSPAAAVAPATGALGYGDVRMALKLAEDVLQHQGISHPAPADVAAVLHGGEVQVNGVAVQQDGLLHQRAQGKQWSEIAQQSGISLDTLMASLRDLPPDQVHHGKAKKSSAKKKAKSSKKAAPPKKKAKG